MQGGKVLAKPSQLTALCLVAAVVVVCGCTTDSREVRLVGDSARKSALFVRCGDTRALISASIDLLSAPTSQALHQRYGDGTFDFSGVELRQLSDSEVSSQVHYLFQRRGTPTKDASGKSVSYLSEGLFVVTANICRRRVIRVEFQTFGS